MHVETSCQCHVHVKNCMWGFVHVCSGTMKTMCCGIGTHTQHEDPPCVLLHMSKLLPFFSLCSGTNVKKWESEMQTLKNNNSRLHTALEESKVNVSQWKTQLQKYKEENDSLKKKVSLGGCTAVWLHTSADFDGSLPTI